MIRILVIEDNEHIIDNTIELLELRGHQVFSSPNGKNALQFVKECKPQIIFCDIMMPESNGYEVFHSLKKDPQTASIPFIFLTASVEKAEVEAALNSGANGYIKKPFEPKDLYDTIDSFTKEGE